MDFKESVAFRSAMENPGVRTVVDPDEWPLFDQPENSWEPRDDEIGLDDQRKLIVYLEEPPYPRLWICVSYKDSPQEHPPRREMSTPRTCGVGGGLPPSSGATNRWYTPQDIDMLSALVCEGRFPDRARRETPPYWLTGVLSLDWSAECSGGGRMAMLRKLLGARLSRQQANEIMGRVEEVLRSAHGWWSKPVKQPQSKGQRPQAKGRGRGRGSRHARHQLLL
jgi:hypothetical protein